jgi:hypothetical protein
MRTCPQHPFSPLPSNGWCVECGGEEAAKKDRSRRPKMGNGKGFQFSKDIELPDIDVDPDVDPIEREVGPD